MRKAQLIVLASIFLSTIRIGCSEQSAEDQRPYSKTVDEAAAWVLAELPEHVTLEVAHIPERGLGHLHFGLAMWIRNNVPVWGNEALLKSVGESDVHPDDVGSMILIEYWKRARRKLPPDELARIEFFESTLSKIPGTKPKGSDHDAVIKELNDQIMKGWPANAAYQPFTLVADPDTYFTWTPDEMGSDIEQNVMTFIGYNRSIAFYEGDNLRIGTPKKAEPKKTSE